MQDAGTPYLEPWLDTPTLNPDTARHRPTLRHQCQPTLKPDTPTPVSSDLDRGSPRLVSRSVKAHRHSLTPPTLDTSDTSDTSDTPDTSDTLEPWPRHTTLSSPTVARQPDNTRQHPTPDNPTVSCSVPLGRGVRTCQVVNPTPDNDPTTTRQPDSARQGPDKVPMGRRVTGCRPGPQQQWRGQRHRAS